MDYLSSMYIDNELNLEDKIQFVDRIHSDTVFYNNTKELIAQEKLLRLPTPTRLLPSRPPRPSRTGQWFKSIFKPLVYTAAGFAAAGLLFFSLMTTQPMPPASANRFVIYEPDAHQVELTGSFTDWQLTPLERLGNSGYWVLTLPIPAGEHRFAYILDGSRQMADPTLPGREKDDFGGENSILNVEVNA